MPTYTSQYPTQDIDHVKATSYYSTSYYPHFATDPAKSLIGGISGNSWSANYATEMRFHIDLGSAKVIKRIYYENRHDSGGSTNLGVQNFTIWGSNTEASFLELTYGTDTGWTQITPAQSTFDEHIAEDQADPKYITITNSTGYRYYAFKFADNHGGSSWMGVRRIELQTEDVVFEYVGTGTLTYSGVAEQSHTCNFIYVSSGSFVTSGSGIYHYEKPDWEYAGSGELAYSGEAIQSHTKDFLYDTSGSFVFSGAGIYSIGFAFTGSGALAFSGDATYVFEKYIYMLIRKIGVSFSAGNYGSNIELED